MKTLLAVIIIILSFNSYAAEDVHNKTLEFVYQLDSEPGSFHFSIGEVNACGSTYYKVKSANDAIADRKFAITLLAFETNASFSFHDTGTCEGNNAIVKWVRIYK